MVRGAYLPDLLQRLVWRARSSPIDALEDLGEALFDFPDTADLTAWLATH